MKTKTVYVVQSSSLRLQGEDLWVDDYFHNADEAGSLDRAKRDNRGYADQYKTRIIKRTEEIVYE